ncbi:MAG: DNA polymerase III subunit delta [Firmicutes bacterium]|nr:DNA polymerase III subunit delta [Bacillota bacterium]
MSGAEYIRKLQKEDPPQISFFFGEEDYWIRTCLSALRERLFPGAEAGFDQEDLNAGEVSAESLANLLRTPAFFGAARLVILRRIEELDAACEPVFLTALSSPVPGVFLAVTAEKPDRRRKIFQELAKKAAVVEARPLKFYEARRWVTEEGRRLGLRIPPDIAELLVEYRGTSLTALMNELEKAALYAGEGKSGPTRDEWLVLLGEPTETNLFAMLDRVSEGKTKEALRLLDQLLAGGEAEMKLFYMLSRQIRLLLLTLLLRQGRGLPLESRDLAKELGCHLYTAEKLLVQVENLSFARLRAAHHRLVQADLRIKTGQSWPRLELEMLLYDLARLFRKK